MVGTLFALGEEIGWQGFLHPQLETAMSPTRASIVTGSVYGIWHLPLLLLTNAYDTGGNRWVVAPIVVPTVTLAGPFYAVLRRRSGSIWSVAIAHRSFNTFIESIKMAAVTSSAALAYIAGKSGIATLVLVGVIAAIVVRWGKAAGANRWGCSAVVGCTSGVVAAALREHPGLQPTERCAEWRRVEDLELCEGRSRVAAFGVNDGEQADPDSGCGKSSHSGQRILEIGGESRCSVEVARQDRERRVEVQVVNPPDRCTGRVSDSPGGDMAAPDCLEFSQFICGRYRRQVAEREKSVGECRCVGEVGELVSAVSDRDDGRGNGSCGSGEHCPPSPPTVVPRRRRMRRWSRRCPNRRLVNPRRDRPASSWESDMHRRRAQTEP